MHACHIVIQIKEPDPFPSPGKKVISPWQEGSLEEKPANMRGKRGSRINLPLFQGPKHLRH